LNVKIQYNMSEDERYEEPGSPLPPGSLSPTLSDSLFDLTPSQVFERVNTFLQSSEGNSDLEMMKELIGQLNEIRVDRSTSALDKSKAELYINELEDRLSLYSNEVYMEPVRTLPFKKGNADAWKKLDINGLLKEEDIRIDEDHVLGSGSFGIVYAGVMKDGRPVAVKRLNAETTEDDQMSFRNEAAIMARIRHPYCCEFVGYLEHPFRLVTRRYPTDLTKYIESGTLTVRDRFRLAYQLTSALCYIHSIGLIHRDLKADNVFIDENGNVRVADFGLTQYVPDKVKDKGSPPGTLLYMAPEQLNEKPFTQSSEIFTLGVILWELFTGNLAYPGVETVEQLIERQKETPMLPVSWRDYSTEPGDEKPPKEIFDLASTCYAYFPENRPELSSVMKKIVDIGVHYSVPRSRTAEIFWKSICSYTYRNHVLLPEFINSMRVSKRAPIHQTLKEAVSPGWALMDITHFWYFCCWFPNFFRQNRAYALMEDIVYSPWYCCDDAQAEKRLRISKDNAFVIRPSLTNPFFEPFTLCVKCKGSVTYHHIIRHNTHPAVTFTCDFTGSIELASLQFMAQYLIKRKGIPVANKLSSLDGVYGKQDLH